MGIDLGGTKILVGVVGADNAILGKAKRSTPAKEGGDAILAAMADAAREARAGDRPRRAQPTCWASASARPARSTPRRA